MTDTIFSQIMMIRASGETNMFELHEVQRLAFNNEFMDLVMYLEEHPMDYIDFILTGGAPNL